MDSIQAKRTSAIYLIIEEMDLDSQKLKHIRLTNYKLCFNIFTIMFEKISLQTYHLSCLKKGNVVRKLNKKPAFFEFRVLPFFTNETLVTYNRTG